MSKKYARIIAALLVGLVLMVVPQTIAKDADATTGATPEIEYQEGVFMKEVEGMLIASIRYKGTYQEMGTFFEKLMPAVGNLIAGYTFALYHDDGAGEVHDIEVCVPVTDSVETEDVKTRFLAGGNVLALNHFGPYDKLSESWEKLFTHITENEIRTTMPVREVYLAYDAEDPANNVTELQVPILKD